jgi:hypothetical protein
MAIITTPAREIELANATLFNNPFVAWSNFGAAATLGGTAVLSGGDRANSVTGSTYDKWRPNVTTTEAILSFDLGTAADVTLAAIASHNAGALGATVHLENSTDGATWVLIASATPANDKPIAFRRESGAMRYWRFRFAGLTAGDALAVGVAFFGSELVIPRRQYQGYAPVLTPTEVQLQSNVSVGGHLLGSSVISRGSMLSAEITNVIGSFIRSADWLSFQTAFGEGKGFFFAWRPYAFPEDLHYCARDGGVIRPENTGPLDFMAIKFSARVYANG